MSDPTTNASPLPPTQDELDALYARAEKAWLERLIAEAPRGHGAETAQTLTLLVQARRGPSSGG